MTNIIPFPPKANTEPVIHSDYWGEEKINLMDLFKILDEVKKQNKDNG